jgi:carotenoid cleavage dioxygenase
MAMRSSPSARPVRHPLLREAVVERRSVLRALGLGATGLALGPGLLAACRGDDDSSDRAGGAGGSQRKDGEPAASVEDYDPDAKYWEQGNFRAVRDEVTETDLEITGAIPPALSGLYLRNGSNPPTGRSPHWFLGDGMVHGVRLESGKASWYRNRYVGTSLHAEGKDFSQAGIPGGAVNQSNVSVVEHAGKVLTLGEVGWPYEISPADLSTVGAWDYGGRLATAMTAHPKIDPDTGKMHFFGYGFADPLLTYHVADAEGALVTSEAIGLDASVMIHDFAITDRDAVFWIGPVMFGVVPDMVDPSFPYYWDPDGPCRVGVMPLDGRGSDIRWVDLDPCMVFHGLNAHHDGDDVVLQVHKVSSAFGPEGDLLPSHLTEWRIDTSGSRLRLRESQMTDVNMDLPTIDRRRTGRPVRHGWFATIDHDGPWGFEFAGINHLDVRTGTEDRWEPGPLERAGEAYFVPDESKGGEPDEGEGWLMTFVYDRTLDRSDLAIFDAQAVSDGPVARVHLPVRVPYGFHGLWVEA